MQKNKKNNEYICTFQYFFVILQAIFTRMRQKGLILMMILILFSSCGEYQKLLKSRDPELKYQSALSYFNQQQYVKAQTLLDDIASYYKGTERSEDVLCYLARCHMGQKNYTSATDYYEAYIRNYPKGKYIIEARFQVGHCCYLESPDARLDQEITRKAINYFTDFTDLYPESPYAGQAYEEMSEMYDKLAQKELYSAKLYYNMGSYLGNNYLSCEIISKNALREYPGNKYQEDFSWLIFMAKYQQVVNSFESLKEERTRDAIDEYYNFLAEYPDSKHKKEADRMLKELKKAIKE